MLLMEEPWSFDWWFVGKLANIDAAEEGWGVCFVDCAGDNLAGEANEDKKDIDCPPIEVAVLWQLLDGWQLLDMVPL